MEDIFEDGTIFLVRKGFAKSGSSGLATYTYVVSKLHGRWFVTGQEESGKGRSWDDLLAWFGRGKILSAQLATDFSPVVVIQ